MEDFNKNIVKWVTYDNEIKKYSDKLKKLRSEKNSFESEIITFIENNDLKIMYLIYHHIHLKFNIIQINHMKLCHISFLKINLQNILMILRKQMNY